MLVECDRAIEIVGEGGNALKGVVKVLIVEYADWICLHADVSGCGANG